MNVFEQINQLLRGEGFHAARIEISADKNGRTMEIAFFVIPLKDRRDGESEQMHAQRVSAELEAALIKK